MHQINSREGSEALVIRCAGGGFGAWMVPVKLKVIEKAAR